MIPLTRLNHDRFYLNPDLIKEMEANPDTVLTLTTRERIVVLETPATVAAEILNFQKQIHSSPAAPALSQKEQ